MWSCGHMLDFLKGLKFRAFLRLVLPHYQQNAPHLLKSVLLVPLKPHPQLLRCSKL